MRRFEHDYVGGYVPSSQAPQETRRGSSGGGPHSRDPKILAERRAAMDSTAVEIEARAITECRRRIVEGLSDRKISEIVGWTMKAVAQERGLMLRGGRCA
jgi:hypothetical protein